MARVATADRERVGRDSARLCAHGELDDPTSAFRDAIAGAYADRAWNQLWNAVESVAEWWAAHALPDAVAVVAGHLDAHSTGSVDLPTRATLAALPDADRLRAIGAAMDRDQLIAYILEHLAAQPELPPTLATDPARTADPDH